MVESVTSTWPGSAPSTSASASPVRVGASIQSGQPLTSSSPHWSITAVQALARALGQPAERVAVEVELVLVGDHEAVAEAGQRVGGVELHARRRGSEPCRAPPSTAGSWGRCGRSGPRRARRAASRRTRAAKRSQISTGTMSSRPPWVSSAGTPSGRRSIGEATLRRLHRRGSGRRRRWRAAARRRAQVEHARLGDDVGDRHARLLAGRRPRREMAAGGVADRHDPREVHGRAWPGGRSRRSRRRASPARRRRCRAAGTRCSTPPSRAPRGPRPARPSASGRTRPSRSRRG